MKIYFFFLFIIFFISAVSAVGFSPSSLVFKLDKNHEQCQAITLTGVTDEIDVINVWAENSQAEWKVGEFKNEASSHGLELSYSINDVENNKYIDVCVQGSKEGEYHGAIIFKQSQQGNSIVQLAVWLKVTITSQEKTESSGSGASSQAISKNQQTANQVQNKIQQLSSSNTQPAQENPNAQALADSTPEENEKTSFNFVYFVLPLVLIILFYIAIKVYSKIKYKRRSLGYI